MGRMNPEDHYLVPCHSNVPDRTYDCVALHITAVALEQLAARTEQFRALRSRDPALYSFEFELSELALSSVELGGEAPYDPPEGLIPLTTFLETQEEHLTLEPLNAASYLVVTEHGMFVTWEGRRDKYGPSETYETDSFSCEELAGEIQESP